MNGLSKRWIVALGGMALALAAGLVIAFVVIARGPSPDAPPPASEGGLVVQTGRDDDIKLDPKRPLRCFVKGQFIGELPLSECAAKNGVATGALDVGLDPSGALAAANGPANLTPLTQAPDAAATNDVVADDSGLPGPGDTGNLAEPIRKSSICWRYGDGQWSRIPGNVDLAACVRTVFADHCNPGEVRYGRWGEQGLRAASGRIELTSEEGDYRPLTTQRADCSITAFGSPRIKPRAAPSDPSAPY